KRGGSKLTLILFQALNHTLRQAPANREPPLFSSEASPAQQSHAPEFAKPAQRSFLPRVSQGRFPRFQASDQRKPSSRNDFHFSAFQGSIICCGGWSRHVSRFIIE